MHFDNYNYKNKMSSSNNIHDVYYPKNENRVYNSHDLQKDEFSEDEDIKENGFDEEEKIDLTKLIREVLSDSATHGKVNEELNNR